jgi:hypothetical protein
VVCTAALDRADIAVDRDQASRLKSDEKLSRDKRNLYLSTEGLLLGKEGDG